MVSPIFTRVGQARLDDLHRQAQRDALARAARRARRHQHRHRTPRLLIVIARWTRRPRPNPREEACGLEGSTAR